MSSTTTSESSSPMDVGQRTDPVIAEADGGSLALVNREHRRGCEVRPRLPLP